MRDPSLSAEKRAEANVLRRRAWDRSAAGYDKRIRWFEKRVFGSDNREWACSRARGDVLEVAIGTGLNIALYPSDVRLTGIDLSPEMLGIAKTRAADIGRDVVLREGDAHDLPWPADSFDAVVCTYSLCNIPDVGRAVGEMHRVLRPSGSLILVDHVRSEWTPVFALQKLIELVARRVEGEHMTRRPFDHVAMLHFDVTERERFRWGGIVERLVARKPAEPLTSPEAKEA